MQWLQHRTKHGCAFVLFANVLSAQLASTSYGSYKEQIYILRSVRTSRVMPSEYCAQSRTGFGGSTFEDRYIFRSVSTRAKDGAILSADGKETASVHACFGKAADANVLNFYGEGEI